MAFQTYDVRAEQLEAVWTLDTPAGPIPLTGGQVSLDRSWTPALQATVEYPSGHELADQVHELSRDPLMLRLRTQTAGIPILDPLAENLVTNSSFETTLEPWLVNSGPQTAYSRSTDWASDGAWSMRAVCTSGSTTSGDIRVGAPHQLPFGIEPGNRYRFSADIYLPAAHNLDGTPSNSRQRRIMVVVYGYSNGNNLYIHYGPQAPNEPGEHRLTHEVDIPANATGVAILLGSAGSSHDPEFVTYWDNIAAQKVDTGTLGEYEWPEDDVYGSRVNQLALWAYPRSTRESRATGRTSVELASADLFMYEQRNGSGQLFVPEPTRIFANIPEYTITRAASQLIVHAGLRVTVKADTTTSSPVDEPTWQPGATVWEFVSGLLRNQWTWRYDPKINTLTLLYSGDTGAMTYDPTLTIHSPIDSVVTRGDSTELGTLDFADGLLITWQWQNRDGGRFTELETVVASHLDDWRDVSKWEEITINSAPQGYGQWLLDQRLVRRAQGTHTVALNPWSLDDLHIKWWNGPTPYQNITFNVADGTATITSPLRED